MSLNERQCYSKYWWAIVLSFVTGISSIWLDGEIVARQFVGTYDLDTDAEIRIGARLNDGRFFKGSISCVQIYNRALSKSEIAAVKERCFHGERFPKKILLKLKNTPWRLQFGVSTDELNHPRIAILQESVLRQALISSRSRRRPYIHATAVPFFLSFLVQ